MVKRPLAMGLLLAVTACASTFPYKYYGLDAASYEGHLLGPKPADDIPFSACKPDEQAKGKCIVILADEFYRFKQDYLETVQRLKECEAPK